MGPIMHLLGSFTGGSQFLILVANPFVETPPWVPLCIFLEASMRVAISGFSSKSVRRDTPIGTIMTFPGTFNGGSQFCILEASGYNYAFPGRFNGGSRFYILVANSFVENPPWAKL